MPTDKREKKSIIQKRVHFTCSLEVFDKIESLKHLLRQTRDKVMENAVTDLFKDVISNIAVKEGLLEKRPQINIKREFFNEEEYPGIFDEICDKLSLKGEGGKISSITSIQLDVINSSVGND